MKRLIKLLFLASILTAISFSIYYLINWVNDKNFDVEITIKEKENIEFGFNLDNFKVQRDTIRFGDSFGEIMLRNKLSYSQIYNIVQSIDLSPLLNIVNNVTLANSFELNQNYPNPFNPTTTINYSINKSGNIKIVIFDMLGKQVKSLVNKNNIAGKHQVLWNGKNEAGKTLPSGQYYYTIEMDGITKSRKMILLK